MHKKNEKFNLAIQKIANPKVIVSLLLALVFVMVLVNIVLKKDFVFLTQTFNYTPEYAYQLLGDIGATGRDIHQLVFLPDILMVLLYTVLLIGANYAVFRKLIKNCFVISIITFSPLILSITQLAEIIILAIVLLQYPNQLFSLIQVSNIITMTKTILTVIIFLMPLAGLCALGINKIVKKVYHGERKAN